MKSFGIRKSLLLALLLFVVPIGEIGWLRFMKLPGSIRRNRPGDEVCGTGSDTWPLKDARSTNYPAHMQIAGLILLEYGG